MTNIFRYDVNMYYVLLPAHLLTLDVVYKLQVRVGAQDLNEPGTLYLIIFGLTLLQYTLCSVSGQQYV